MYRILLVSDTHGNLKKINELAEETAADMVIHAGDFGFYDEDSLHRLSARELRLLIWHSSISSISSVSKNTDRKTIEDIVLKHKLLGDFSDYLVGKKHFSVPVYAVWGNHEDAQVIRKLREGVRVTNLHLLDEFNVYEFNNKSGLEFSLYGLGGNFSARKSVIKQHSNLQGSKLWSSLHQFGLLYQNLKHNKGASIFVSHVSPGKEPLLTALMARFMPNFWISGHMGAPYACVWNQFTIRKIDESLSWLETDKNAIEQAYQSGGLSNEAIIAYDLLKQPLSEYWLKKLWNFNLPDINQGHALLILNEGRFALQTEARGVTI